MKRSPFGTPRERVLAAIGLVLLLGVGGSYARDALYLPKKNELFRETRRAERKLQELEYLRVRSEEIRERYEALDRESRESPHGSPVTPEDLLQRLEATAKGSVHLVKVHPEPLEGAGADSQTRLSLEFLDERGGLDEFLHGLVQELGGDVHAFQASVTGQEIRCQATVVFSHDPRSPDADVEEDAGGEI